MIATIVNRDAQLYPCKKCGHKDEEFVEKRNVSIYWLEENKDNIVSLDCSYITGIEKLPDMKHLEYLVAKTSCLKKIQIFPKLKKLDCQYSFHLEFIDKQPNLEVFIDQTGAIFNQFSQKNDHINVKRLYPLLQEPKMQL